MLSTVKSFKMLPKNNGCDYFHCRQILIAIVNLHCEIRILEYLVSAVIVICLILVLVLHQELKYIFLYYQHALTNYCLHQNNCIFT